MTMGVIGTILIFIPFLFVLPRCIRRLSEHDEFAWFWFGGAIWLVSALVTSITLVTLFSTAGLVFSAVFLSVLAQTLHAAETAPQRLETSSDGVPPAMRRRRREDVAVPG